MRDKYFCLNKKPKIIENLKLGDELYLTNQFIEILEKEKKRYFKNNDKNNFSAINLAHYNNKYIYF